MEPSTQPDLKRRAEVAFLVAAAVRVALHAESVSKQESSKYHLYRYSRWPMAGSEPRNLHRARAFVKGLMRVHPAGLYEPFNPPRYPLPASHDVHRCDLQLWTGDVWEGMRQLDHRAKEAVGA